MNFYNFMMKNYLGTDMPGGDLAKDMWEDKEKFPRNGVGKYVAWHKLIRSYLVGIGPLAVESPAPSFVSPRRLRLTLTVSPVSP